MFRPYNLTSLTAWTIGSLAGNEAYYRTKGASRHFTFKKTSVPPIVLRFNQKLEAICNEINLLTGRLCEIANVTDGKFELTPLVHLMAYYEWFEKSKESIKAEAREVCEISMSGIRNLVSNEVKGAEAAVDTFSAHLSHAVGGMQKSFLNNMPDLKERQRLLDMLKKRQASCRVNESSYKLTDSNSGKFFIQSRTS